MSLLANMDATMAWRNVWRNPRRSLLTMAAIAFAVLLVLFMLSFQFGSYEAMIDNAVRLSTGHLQVQAQGYLANPDMRKVVEDPAAVAGLLDSLDRVTAHAARCRAFALLSSDKRTSGGMVVGIDPAAEPRVSTLAQRVTQGEFLAPGDMGLALVGDLLARNLGVGLGDEVVVLGQGRDGSFAATVYTVKGLFATGQEEMDRSTMAVDLADFQDVFFMGSAVHEIVVLADSLSLVAGLQQDVQSGLAGLPQGSGLVALTWDELLPGVKQSIQMDLMSGLIFYFLLILVVAFSILNTFLMAVFERTREWGVMLAMGATPMRLVRLVLLESGFTTLLGILAGTLLGLAVTGYFQAHGIPLSGATAELVKAYGIAERMYPTLTLLSVSLASLSVLVVTMLSAVYPALRVRRLKPAAALAAA